MIQANGVGVFNGGDGDQTSAEKAFQRTVSEPGFGMTLHHLLAILRVGMNGHFTDLAARELGEVRVTSLDGVDHSAGDEDAGMSPEEGFVGRVGGQFLKGQCVDGIAHLAVGQPREKTR